METPPSTGILAGLATVLGQASLEERRAGIARLAQSVGGGLLGALVVPGEPQPYIELVLGADGLTEDYPTEPLTRWLQELWEAGLPVQTTTQSLEELGVTPDSVPAEIAEVALELVLVAAFPLQGKNGWVMTACADFLPRPDLLDELAGLAALVPALLGVADAQAQQREQTQAQFLSFAAHELKTPLTTIKGYSQMLQRRLRNTIVKGQEGMAAFDFNRTTFEADQMREEADRLTHLVDQLLDVSRIQTKRLAMHPQTLDLRVLLPETLDKLRSTLDGREIVYQGPRERTSLTVQADAERIKQVITSLVDNALRFSPAEKPIEVRLRGVAEKDQLGRIVITVRDQGIGLAPQDLPRVFEQSFRPSEPTGVKPGGMGVSLFIAQEIVRQHGGTLRAESAGLGQGSTFTLELPRATEDSGEST